MFQGGNLKILSALLVSLLSLSVSASEEDAATELFTVLQMEQLLAQKAINYKKQMVLALASTEMPDEERAELEQEYSVIVDKIIAFLSTEEVLEAFKHSYSETFTESELRDLVTFYASPTGKKFLSQSGNLNAKFMEKISPKFNSLISEFQQVD